MVKHIQTIRQQKLTNFLAFLTILWGWYLKSQILSNRYQTAFRLRHIEFGTPSQCFAYEMISKWCKSKPYTVFWENKFSASNFPEADSVGKVSHLPLTFVHVLNLPAGL